MDYFTRIGDEWRQRAPELATWTMNCLVNRTDVWGRYLPKRSREREDREYNHAITAPFRDERGKVLLGLSSLEKHFRTRDVGGVLGLHSTSADLTSRWFAIDIDLHDEEELSVSAEGNFAAAKHWRNQLVERGFDPILMDSNGRGGFHLLVIFADAMNTHSVSRFVKEIVSDYVKRGLDEMPQVFPGKPQWHHYGDWLRLPGRHHTHDHYTRVWNDEPWAERPWLDGHDAIDRLLAAARTDATICAKNGIDPKRHTVCLDFDGVIHSYVSGWRGIEVINDPPIHGTDEAIRRLRKQYRIVVHSARCATQEGRDAVETWLKKYNIEVDEICEHKPPALVYVDDRAIRFTGDWIAVADQIRDFRK
jgi:hypothetical protein